MTFGRTLQELTRLCGVKRCNLADALGYDPSYISRWINGVKHPSLRSNDALPAQIAAYLTANAAPDVRARIAGQFDLRCDAADDAGFSRRWRPCWRTRSRPTGPSTPRGRSRPARKTRP